jgi:hypothetical protein
MSERTEWKRGTTKYENSCSLYTDDAALFFNSRAHLERDTSGLCENLLNFGLTMHIGTEQCHHRLRQCTFHSLGDSTLLQIPRG